MGVFDIFKKKEAPSYDATNLQIQDLKLGYMFDYDLSSWIIEAEYEYDWGDDCFSKEYKINNGSETKYMAVEDDDELIVTITSKLKLHAIDEDLKSYILEHDTPPKKIKYQDRKYFLEEECPGYFRDLGKGDTEWTELISWDYEDDTDYVICIEQWGAQRFEASEGKCIKAFEITNILPK